MHSCPYPYELLIQEAQYKKMVATYNHQSLQAEHGIKSLSTILTIQLTDLVQMWPKYLSLVTLVYNIFNTPNVANYRPY